ncbi:MAG: hypothetical protein AVO39_05025 [delta proteobacterium MLS_D]|nr:MAG: hypothetical protein AVO39_05025 [delta proteobacterium MLS_D]
MRGVTLENIMDLMKMLKESGIDEMRLQTDTLKIHLSKSGPKDSASESIEPAEELLPVKAAMLGFFEGVPAGGHTLFPLIGRYVKEGDELCAIRVLDRLHVMKADFSGWIRRIVPSEGELVEYRQTLFLVEPAGDVPGGTT